MKRLGEDENLKFCPPKCAEKGESWGTGRTCDVAELYGCRQYLDIGYVFVFVLLHSELLLGIFN